MTTTNATRSALPAPLSLLLPVLRMVGGGRGIRARVCRDAQPTRMLELYSYEWCASCRRVRATLTELDLDYVHRSCPVGDGRNRATVLQRGGRARFPYLVDPNTGVEIYDSRAIIDYLEAHYGDGAASPDAAATAPGIAS